MTVDMERYAELLYQFQGISQSHIDREALDKLKEEYKDKIRSRRVLETITDINSLLKVLEKRGILQYDEIKVLKDIARQYVKDESVKKLLLDYEQWLREKPSKLNNLYSCGKSSNLSNNSVSKTAKSYNVHENISNHESEEQCRERLLLLEEPYTYVNQPQIINRNFFSTIIFKKCPERCKKKKYIVISFLTMVLLIILTCIIWILVKISYHSAVVTSKENPDLETSTQQSTMPYFASNFNMGVSQESRFTLNQTQYYSSSTTVPPIDREKKLQELILSKISRRIGNYYWRTVARKLNVEESYIDDLDNQYLNQDHASEKAFKKVLNSYFSEHRSDWKVHLMQALESSGRTDLKEEVFEILYQ